MYLPPVGFARTHIYSWKREREKRICILIATEWKNWFNSVLRRHNNGYVILALPDSELSRISIEALNVRLTAQLKGRRGRGDFVAVVCWEDIILSRSRTYSYLVLESYSELLRAMLCLRVSAN